MAWTLTDLDNMKASLASAESEVQLEGRSVKFISVADKLKAIAAIEADLASRGITSGIATRRKTLVATSSNFSGADNW